jgi:hypothetical protein
MYSAVTGDDVLGKMSFYRKRSRGRAEHVPHAVSEGRLLGEYVERSLIGRSFDGGLEVGKVGIECFD